MWDFVQQEIVLKMGPRPLANHLEQPTQSPRLRSLLKRLLRLPGVEVHTVCQILPGQARQRLVGVLVVSVIAALAAKRRITIAPVATTTASHKLQRFAC